MPRTNLLEAALSRAQESAAVLDEVLAGEGLSFSDAAKMLPGKKSKPMNSVTLYRWALKGVPSRNGKRLHLEYCLIGCQRVTSKPALRRFIEAQNGLKSEAGSPFPERACHAKRKREAEVAAAEKALRAANVA